MIMTAYLPRAKHQIHLQSLDQVAVNYNNNFITNPRLGRFVENPVSRGPIQDTPHLHLCQRLTFLLRDQDALEATFRRLGQTLYHQEPFEIG